ncbi:hypothetical protein R3P38DRAFT_3291968 [Favolaschia claudopus]|uniref:SET domain-containing protein n=1 Tax=Favolaschia claudopus TaxID=2862362 RepID=A0AAV9ZM52_9AGAR
MDVDSRTPDPALFPEDLTHAVGLWFDHNPVRENDLPSFRRLPRRTLSNIQRYARADDVTVFLKALMFPDFFEPHPAPASYAVLTAVLRMSHKYDVATLGKRALVHVSSQFPTQLHDYESLASQEDPPWITELKDVDGPGFHSLTALARSLSIEQVNISFRLSRRALSKAWIVSLSQAHHSIWTRFASDHQVTMDVSWAEHLSQSPSLTASAAVTYDDAVVLSLFGQRKHRPPHRAHTIARMSAREDDAIPHACAEILQRRLNANKAALFTCATSPRAFELAINELLALPEWTAQTFPNQGLAFRAIKWLAQAHLTMLAPWASTRLKLFRFDPNDHIQFGVFAHHDIPANVLLPELLGQLSRDNVNMSSKVETTHLSEMFARNGTTRVLYGPIRFVNHSCNPNSTYEELRYNSERTISVRTLRPIQSGQQVTVDYGPGFFDADHICACDVCRPTSSTDPPAPSPVIPVDPDQKRQARNRKNAKQHEKRRKTSRVQDLSLLPTVHTK